jgi:hypothetical protein
MIKAYWLCIAACCGFVAVADAQPDAKKLTARELFYSAVETPSAPAAAAKAGKPETPAKVKPSRRRAHQQPETAPATSNPSEEIANSRPTSRPETPSNSESVPVINAAYKPHGAGMPLGLRYTVLKKTGDVQAEIDADTVFHAGDRIRLSVQTNTDGHLYVVTRGSSGTWKLLFPSGEIEGGDNSIQKLVSYQIPAGYTFTFDEQPGEEKLFIVFSRQPEPDIEKLIYSLGQGGSTPATTEPAAPQRPKLLLASAAFSDDMIGKLRNTYARDLIIEKVDDQQSGTKQEKAVYAVNPTGSADSRVVADITLKHQ